MTGGDHFTPPDDYVEKLLRGNFCHTDGSLETPDEKDSIWELLEYIEDYIPYLFEDQPPRNILVPGCRTGAECRALKQRFPEANVVGLDIVPKFLQLAARIAQEEGCDVSYRYGDICNMSTIQDGRFDLVICQGTLEHCYNVTRAAAELRRVGSRYLYVTADLRTPNQGTSDYAWSEDPDEWRKLFTRRPPEAWHFLDTRIVQGTWTPAVTMLLEKPQ